jgi:hypothetical protein
VSSTCQPGYGYIGHLPAQNNQINDGREITEALRKRYSEVTVHDVFHRDTLHTDVSTCQVMEKLDGIVVAAAQFTKERQDRLPDTLIYNFFPGWIELRGIRDQVMYVNRRDRCFRYTFYLWSN